MISLNVSDTNNYMDFIRQARKALTAGELVIFPTETVYGVGASARHDAAIEALRAAKGRSDQQAFTVHIGRPGDAEAFVNDDAVPIARRLARKLWPGPLTLICDVPSPESTTCGQRLSPAGIEAVFFENTVGLRCPSHPVCADLLDAADVCIASSANPAGATPPVDFADAVSQLGNRVHTALDGGPCSVRTASTIVRVGTDSLSIARTGALSERQIMRAARAHVLMVCTGNSCRSPLAEYLFRAQLQEIAHERNMTLNQWGVDVSSAGTHAYPGGPISSGSLQELQKRGIDARTHQSSPVSVERLHEAERIYVMSNSHRETILATNPAFESRIMLLDPAGDIHDPIGGGPDQYRKCAIAIEQAVTTRIEEFVHEDRNWQ